MQNAHTSGFRQQTQVADEVRLQKHIQYRGRYWPCKATNRFLAECLGWSLKRVKRVLRRLRNRNAVLSVTNPSLVLIDGFYEWRTTRTMFLVSRADAEHGALTAANLVRNIGRTTRISDDQACARLQCTPAQWGEWLTLACRKGYIDELQDKEGRRVLARTGNFPAVALPQADSPPVPPATRPSTLDELVARVRKSDEVQGVGTFKATDSELGKLLNVGRAFAQRVRSTALRQGLLYCWREDGKWVLSTSPRPAEGPGAPLPWSLERLVRQLRDHGPLMAREMLLHAGLPLDTPLPTKKLRAAGVCTKRFGNRTVFSLGPVPKEFVEAERERQQQRKAERNRARRKWKKLGLVPSDEYVLLDTQPVLQGLCYQACQFGFGGPDLDSLRREAWAFVQAIPNEVLAVHLRAARVESNTTDVTPAQVATKVFAAVREEFVGRAVRLRRSLQAERLSAAG